MVGIDKIPDLKLRWNTSEEILLYLTNANINQQSTKKKVVIRPRNGTMHIYDRTKVRYRTDGYEWKKRKDGKNVREDHMKLKVDGVECLYGSYVHNATVPNFHRRCYWKLKSPKIVLVHYLYVPTSTDVSPPPPSAVQIQNALSQFKNIFGVTPDGVLNNPEHAKQIESINNHTRQILAKPQTPEAAKSDSGNCTKPSQLLLILDKNGINPKLKKILCKDNLTSEDKNTQTDSHENGPCSSTFQTCAEPSFNSLTTESEHSMLVGKNNPNLSNPFDNVLVDPFYDPLLSTPIGSDSDVFFSDHENILKDDLAHLKDTDMKLFELFEDCMSSTQPIFPSLSHNGHTPADIIHVADPPPATISNGTAHTTTPIYPSTTPSYTPHNHLYPTPVVHPSPLGPVLPSAEYPVQISAVSPDWAYTYGGEKVIVVGEWEQLQGPSCVMFGNNMVPAHQLRPGVLQVICPSSPCPGPVTINIVSEGIILTNPNIKFTYKEQDSPKSWLNVVDSNFKHSLINRLETLESQVQILSSRQFSGDLQSRMCCISLHVLCAITTTTAPLPPAPRGLRLIHLAAGLGYSRLITMLLKFPNLPECNPCSLDKMGNNAVVWASVRGHTNTIYILLKYFPCLRNSRDGWGRPIKWLYKSCVSRRRTRAKGEMAARTIQLYYRTYQEKKRNEATTRIQAATRIQSRFRTYKQQCSFEQVRKAVVIIQQSYRDHMRHKEVAAKTIQRCWRQTSRQRRVLGLTNNTLTYF